MQTLTLLSGTIRSLVRPALFQWRELLVESSGSSGVCLHADQSTA